MMPRPAYSLVELLVVITVIGVVCALALPKVWDAADRAAARGAATDIAAVFGEARDRAIAARRPVAVNVDTIAASIVAMADGTPLVRRAVGDAYGVRLWASRDSMAYDARGLGFGAANLTVIVRRGRAAETVSVSRLGRVRR